MLAQFDVPLQSLDKGMLASLHKLAGISPAFTMRGLILSLDGTQETVLSFAKNVWNVMIQRRPKRRLEPMLAYSIPMSDKKGLYTCAFKTFDGGYSLLRGMYPDALAALKDIGASNIQILEYGL